MRCYDKCGFQVFMAVVMTIKFSEDLAPLTDLKVNPGA